MVSQWMGQNKIHGNALVPLLIGAQGDGKSTFCKLLLPESLRMYYTDRIDFANKNDAERSLSRFALINIDEFDSITKRQQAFLKLILQKTSSMLRQLYSQNIRETPRLSAFIATTNEPTPLTDPSGSRRYLCIRTEGIIDTRSPIDYAQLFAQLKAEVNRGDRIWFTGDDEADIQKSNREFEQFDSNKEIFLELFHKPKGSENGENMPLSRIIHEMHQRNRSIREDDATFKKVGKMLKRLRFKHHHSRTGSEYYVIRNSAVTTP
jgi:predicted P-loop ATPase